MLRTQLGSKCQHRGAARACEFVRHRRRSDGRRSLATGVRPKVAVCAEPCLDLFGGSVIHGDLSERSSRALDCEYLL